MILVGLIIIGIVFLVISVISCIIIGAEADERDEAEYWRQIDEQSGSDESV